MTSQHVDRSINISLIMPVLNEETRLRDQLEAIVHLSGIHDIVVVDGGSSDRTIELAQRCRRVRVARAPRGRGSQMNAGARLATGNVYLFLHADVRLPDDAAAHVRNTLADHHVVAGAFRTWTVSDCGRTWLSPFLHLADLRSRYTALPYGDQAMFVRAEVFWSVDGFPEQPLMEDLELSRRLRRAGTVRTVPARVDVSGRRFIARPLYYAALDNVLPLLYRIGVSPRRLARLYGDPR